MHAKRPGQSARVHTGEGVNPGPLPFTSVIGTAQLPEQTARLEPHGRCTLPLGWEELKNRWNTRVGYIERA